MFYVGYGENNAITGYYKTCTTGLQVLNWTESETVELSEDLINQGLSPVDDSIGDTIPDLDVNVQSTPTFNPLATPNTTFPIEVPTATPAPRDSDGDGVLDDVDRCPVERGVPEYNGCPPPPTVIAARWSGACRSTTAARRRRP